MKYKFISSFKRKNIYTFPTSSNTSKIKKTKTDQKTQLKSKSKDQEESKEKDKDDFWDDVNLSENATNSFFNIKDINNKESENKIHNLKLIHTQRKEKLNKLSYQSIPKYKFMIPKIKNRNSNSINLNKTPRTYRNYLPIISFSKEKSKTKTKNNKKNQSNNNKKRKSSYSSSDSQSSSPFKKEKSNSTDYNYIKIQYEKTLNKKRSKNSDDHNNKNNNNKDYKIYKNKKIIPQKNNNTIVFSYRHGSIDLNSTINYANTIYERSKRWVKKRDAKINTEKKLIREKKERENKQKEEEIKSIEFQQTIKNRNIYKKMNEKIFNENNNVIFRQENMNFFCRLFNSRRQRENNDNYYNKINFNIKQNSHYSGKEFGSIDKRKMEKFKLFIHDELKENI